jgi:hypothetical protein
LNFFKELPSIKLSFERLSHHHALFDYLRPGIAIKLNEELARGKKFFQYATVFEVEICCDFYQSNLAKNKTFACESLIDNF